MKANYKVREFNCKGCGVFVRKRCPAKTKFCSLTCYRSMPSRPARRTGEDVPCGNCGTKIYVQRSALRGKNFCSVPCHDEHQGRNKVSYICKICGAAFKWSPSREKSQNPTYCSIRCRNECSEWRLNSTTAANLKQCRSKGLNRLESAGSRILWGLGVEFQEQVLIAEKFVVDAFIPSLGIVVQWDGDYWHGYRAAGDDRPLDDRQLKRSKLDVSQDAYMNKCGYTVLRFWEHEVHKQPEMVNEVIKEAVRSLASRASGTF